MAPIRPARRINDGCHDTGTWTAHALIQARQLRTTGYTLASDACHDHTQYVVGKRVSTGEGPRLRRPQLLLYLRNELFLYDFITYSGMFIGDETISSCDRALPPSQPVVNEKPRYNLQTS